MSNRKIAYQCIVDNIKLIADNKELVEIDSNRISSIIIDHKYEANIMPVIYLVISVNARQYNLLLQNRKKGKIYLRIRKQDIENNTIPIDKIHNQFVYFLSNNDLEYVSELSDEELDDDLSSIRLTIGLMDASLINYNKTVFNNIYRKVHTSDIILSLISGRNMIVSSLENDAYYEQLILPPCNSRASAINWLFNRTPFYTTSYSYFTDFECSYLYNRSGDGINTKGNYKDIYFKIVDINTDIDIIAAEGMVKDTTNKCYVIEVREDDKNSTPNQALTYVANNIMGVNEMKNTKSTITIDGRSKYAGSGTMIVRAKKEVVQVLKSDIITSEMPFSTTRCNVDADIFTPDKRYIVSNTNRDIKKKGVLISKKEVLIHQGETFVTSTTLNYRIINTN